VGRQDLVDTALRGEILSYDPMTGDGLISGDDLRRYAFTSTTAGLDPGRRVDFVVQDDRALSLMVLRDAPLPTAVYAAEPDLGVWGYFIRCVTDLYADGHGRARRKEYWSFVLFQVLILMLMVLPFLGLTTFEGETSPDFGALGLAWFCFVGLVYVALVIPYFTVMIRRLHDVGLSGWLILIGLIPYFGGMFLFVVSLLPSQPAVNAYGAPPKGLGGLQTLQDRSA
jgi:uncharacterized membrane protein YhaH (DUF805 family)